MTKTTLEVGDLLSVFGAHGLSLRGEALPRHICDKPTLPGSGPKDLTGQLKHVALQRIRIMVRWRIRFCALWM